MGDSLQHIDLNALAELREVMEDEFPILIETFLNDSVNRIVQIREAVAAGAADQFGRACHGFKGSCINIGAPQLAELCKRGELMGHQRQMDEASQLVAEIEAEFRLVQEILPQQTG